MSTAIKHVADDIFFSFNEMCFVSLSAKKHATFKCKDTISVFQVLQSRPSAETVVG